ncbi:MAG: methyltransferase, TIGR04325 family [Daejeonella sp.]
MVTTLIQFYRRVKYNTYGWFGNYDNWETAKAKCTGYNAMNILGKIKNGALKVKNGEAVFERDGVLYDKIEHSWPLLAHLLSIAQQNRISVLDFGGSLGTSYFENQPYIKSLKEVKWSVIEQTEFVTTGNNEIARDALKFYYTIDEAIQERGLHDVFLISCALPYIEKPYEFLADVSARNFPYIIINNTYFNPLPADRLTIQKVPAYYYEASYPAWFLNYERVKEMFLDKYEIVAEFTNDSFLYLYGEKINYRGICLRLKN